jgi:hypothetical protein
VSPSDLLRFFNNHLFVYSDVSPSDLADSPADVGVPPVSTQFPSLIFQEQGGEVGPNGLFGYLAVNETFPGFATSLPDGVQYSFVSDPVPEPASLVLASAAAAGILLFVRRQS